MAKVHHPCEPVKDRQDIPRGCAVYKIENPIGEIYVGGSTNAFKRYGQYSGNSFKGQPKLFASFEKYGKEKHTFEVIEECEKSDLHKRERYWSLFYDVIEKGLNLDITGDGENPVIRDKDVLRRIGDGHRGKPPHPNALAAFLKMITGKKQSPEHIEKRKMWGEKNPMYGKPGYWKGKKIPEHVKEKLREANKDKFLGKNNNAKKVIDITTGEIYDCAKRVALMLGIKYKTFLAQLQGRNKNKTNFRYL